MLISRSHLPGGRPARRRPEGSKPPGRRPPRRRPYGRGSGRRDPRRCRPRAGVSRRRKRHRPSEPTQRDSRGTTGDLVAAIRPLERPRVPTPCRIVLAHARGAADRTTRHRSAEASRARHSSRPSRTGSPVSAAVLSRIEVGALVRTRPGSGTRYRVDATPSTRRRHPRGRKHRDARSTRCPDPARQVAIERAERAKQKEERLLRNSVQRELLRFSNSFQVVQVQTFSGRDFRGARLAFVLWSEANPQGAQLKGGPGQGGPPRSQPHRRRPGGCTPARC